jgi:hypothetical protein
MRREGGRNSWAHKPDVPTSLCAGGGKSEIAMIAPATTSKQHVPLAAIQFDSATQVRAQIDVGAVAEYAERMEANDQFPAPTLFQDGEVYFIGDGWHRLLAAQKNGAVTFPCSVGQGGREAAIKHALGANSEHGLKRTTADKQNAVRLALKHFAEKSDRELAKLCRVDHKTVAAARQLGNSPVEGKRVGADGKSRKMPTRAAAPASTGPTWDPASGEPKPEWAKAMERFDAVKNDEFGPIDDEPAANSATAASQAATATVVPATAPRSFDAPAWKIRAGTTLKGLLADVPAKLQAKAANWLGEAAGKILNGEDPS